MSWEFVLCDVFTEVPLAGNQLAVFPDARVIPERRLQKLARETNFSETVFVYPPRGRGDARIRIFTPGTELPFAGHPILGTATVLGLARGTSAIVLECKRGPVPVTLEPGKNRARGWMVQPIPEVRRFARASELCRALGVKRSLLPVEVYDNGIQHVYVNVGTEAEVAALRPDAARLAELAPHVGVNCFAGAGTRWKTRMFAADMGVSEDPATGSAAGPLAAHLVRHGVIRSGTRIEIRQGAEIGRPSKLLARVTAAEGRITRQEVGGTTIVVGRGVFAL